MNNLEKLIQECKTILHPNKNEIAPFIIEELDADLLKKLLEIIKVQNESLREIFEYHSGKFGTPIFLRETSFRKNRTNSWER